MEALVPVVSKERAVAKARQRAARAKLTTDDLLRDIVVLLDQIGTIEHQQDHALIQTLRARYGVEIGVALS